MHKEKNMRRLVCLGIIVLSVWIYSVKAQFGFGGYGGGFGGFFGGGRQRGGYGGYGGYGGGYDSHSIFGGHSSSILSVSIGSFIPGGIPVFVRVRNLQECQKVCDLSGTCQAGDWNAHTRQCYQHSSATACNAMSHKPGLTHFKKIPCTAPAVGFATAANSQVFAGTFVSGGLEVAKKKSLNACIKECDQLNQGTQKCFGIDYNNSDKKCYVHVTEANVCPTAATAANRRTQLDTTHIALCP